MPSLRSEWRTTLQKKISLPFFLFLDFDGTLVPIARRPGDVRLPVSVRRTLQTLSRVVPIAIISGRSLVDIKSRVGLPNVTYAGNHGLEIEGRGFRYRMKGFGRWQKFLEKLASLLEKDFEGIPGLIIEDKGYSLSIHYRLARKQGRLRATRLFRKRLKPLIDEGRVRVGLGKCVWEIRPPVEWDKGRAVLWILERSAFREKWPLYFGDDKTDQDAFRAIRKTGVGFAVGPPASRGQAHYSIRHPRDVHALLDWLGKKMVVRIGY